MRPPVVVVAPPLASLAPLAPLAPLASLALPALLALVAGLAACPLDPAPGGAGLVPLPPLASAPTTLVRTILPVREAAPGGDNPALPEHTAAWLDEGYGATQEGPGEQLVVRTVDDGAPPPRGSSARLVRFVHLADIQLMDDEAPTRAATFDSESVASALRPQEPQMCRMLNAAVRTINALHAEDPIDFVLLGGDNADSAQRNEVSWVMEILNGADEVHCDSGADDDIDADAEDGKDRFAAPGLDVPWRWVSGNHDVTVQGTFTVNDAQIANALGIVAELGTREYSSGGFGAVLTGDVVIPDAARALLDGPALLELVGGDADGHGLANADRAAGKAFHSFDVGAITFMVLDTTHLNGGSGGVLQRRHVDRFVTPVLDDARSRGQVVVLASHHSVSSLSIDGGTFGAPEDDAMLGDDWLAFLGAYPNVLFSMVGHAHEHRVTLQQTPGHAFWEVMTSALADWPHQFRIVEIHDDDNGTLRLETSPVDFVADDDPPAALGRALGLIDALSGWNGSGEGTPNERNVALIAPTP